MSTTIPTNIYKNKEKIAVIGATGKLGRNVVIQLSSLGIPVKCLIRPTKETSFDTSAPSIESKATSSQVAKYLSSLPNVELIQGDVVNQESILSLLQDCSACLAVYGARRTTKLSDFLPWTNPEEDDPSHSKQVNYQGVKNIIAAAQSSSCKRIVRITGKGEDPFSFFTVLINLFGSMAKAWNYEGEQLLRACTDIDYTIIRPGVMSSEEKSDKKTTSDDAVLALADNGGSLPVSSVSYHQIASLCIECLQYTNTKRCTLCAMNVSKGGAKSYAPLLSQVRADTKQFPSGLLEKHYLAARLGAAFLFTFGSGFFALITMFIKFLFFK